MHLPLWLQVLVGHLDLNLESSHALGGDPALLATVRAAIELSGKRGSRLKLLSRMHLDGDLKHLHLVADDLPALETRFRDSDSAQDSSRDWHDPRHVELLPELLSACLGDRLLNGTNPDVVEREVDQLHQLVHEQERSETHRLEDAKLSSLAEFAAGASHEINNPLAVISGQAQYLLKTEVLESRRESLRAIVRQANRIHSILTEVMQFARPSVPAKRLLSIRELLQLSLESVRLQAETSKVRLDAAALEQDYYCSVDSKQIQIALTSLLRNGIEAAPVDGWVRVAVNDKIDGLEIVVEDSGPGLTDHQRQHAFDPFFSGRSAGRGRGFGLPIAWRLAQENGGEVRHEPNPTGPTRFVLRLPLEVRECRGLRQSA